jgi:hypothetical protein
VSLFPTDVAVDLAHEPVAEDLPVGPGVVFPTVDGRRSSTAAARAILADAAAAIDEDLALRIRGCEAWRSGYVELLHELTAAGARGPRAPLAVAAAGIASTHRHLEFERDGVALALGEALAASPSATHYSCGSIQGRGEVERELVVPYRDRQLRGESLAEQLELWVRRGVVERSFATAVMLVAAHPEWLALPDRTVVLVGAGAELSPLGPLCRWGASVAAIDLPEVEVAGRIAELARAGAGLVTVPVGADGAQGADVTRALPELCAWLRSLRPAGELALGMYAYADGGMHVRVSAAFDALADALLASRPRTALAFLGTPTDAYLVPAETVAAAREAYAARRLRRVLQAPLKLATAGRVFRPAYGEHDRVADALISQQGPNYALAKRVQRWRGLLARERGQLVSFNVAPASWTRSVTKNRVLAAAYAGAHRHGVEIFPAQTTCVLMAAMLVHDLNNPAPASAEPERLFSDGAAHGGLWRAAYEPRSVLGFAAVTGLPATLLPGGGSR